MFAVCSVECLKLQLTVEVPLSEEFLGWGRRREGGRRRKEEETGNLGALTQQWARKKREKKKKVLGYEFCKILSMQKKFAIDKAF